MYAAATRSGSRVFQASSAACTLARAPASSNGGSGGRGGSAVPAAAPVGSVAMPGRLPAGGGGVDAGRSYAPAVLTATTSVLLDDLGFPEAPRWHEGRLRFSDFLDRRVRALDPDGTVETLLELDDSPSGLGWTPDGTLLVVAWSPARCSRSARPGPGCAAT